MPSVQFPARSSTASSASAWHVALLRGVNVGGGNRVPMADLTAIVHAAGFAGARTLLNSGNVVYRAGRTAPRTAASRIRRGVKTTLGVDTPVIVRTRDALAQVLADNPMPAEAAAQPSRFLVMLFDDDVTDATKALIEAQPVTVERFRLGPQAAYLWVPEGISVSKPFELLGRQLGRSVTSRNWNTMTKLLEMMTDA